MKNFDKLWENYDYHGKLEWEVAEDFYRFALEQCLRWAKEDRLGYFVRLERIKKELGEEDE